MILETAFALLACARLLSVVFGSFAPKELAKCITEATPSIILAASCGLEPKGVIDYGDLVSQALEFTSHRCLVVMLQRTEIRGYKRGYRKGG